MIKILDVKGILRWTTPRIRNEQHRGSISIEWVRRKGNQRSNERKRKSEEHQEEQRGVITLLNTPGFIPQFTRVERQHGFRVANNTEKNVRDLSTNAKTPLKERNSCVVYNIVHYTAWILISHANVGNASTQEKQEGGSRQERNNTNIRSGWLKKTKKKNYMT